MTNTQVDAQTSPNGVTTSTTASVVTHNVGDLVVFTCTVGGTFHVTGLSSSHTTGWTEIGTAGGIAQGSSEVVQVFWGTVTSVTTATVTISYSSSSSTSNGVCWNLYQYHSDIAGATWSVDSYSENANLPSSTTLAGATLTPTSGTGLLGIEFWACSTNGANGTTPGWSWNAVDFYANVNAYNLSVGGATTPSATQSPAGGYSRIAALFKPAPPFTPISASDTFTGSDSVSALSAATTQSDTGTSSASISGTASGSLTDTGTGADGVAVAQLQPLAPVNDTGTGSDSVAVAQYFSVAPTDSGTGADSVSALSAATTQSDAGTGADSVSALKAFLPTQSDSGTGADSLAGVVSGTLSDTGTGVDGVAIVNIPFAQIIPAFRPGPVYDLVVMARVPQQTTKPVFIQVDPIEWSTLSYINTLSAPQTLNLTCLISSLPDTIITRFRDLATQPTELWLYRDGHLIFAGPVMGGNARGLELDVTALGIAAYMNGWIVTADQVYSNVDQFTVVKGLVDAWQALDYGNYGIDTSQIGTSGVTISPTYLATELRNVANEINSLSTSGVGFDYLVDPITRQLQCFYPTKGVDRSTGDNAVIFDARNISSTDFMFSVSPQDLATEAFTTGTSSTGTGNVYATASNTALRTQYGRTGYAQSFNNVVDQTSLNNFASGLLLTRSAELITPGPDAKDVPDADLSSYSVGDTIMYQPNPLLTVPRAYRIRKQTVNVSNTGVESVSLEFA